MQRLEVSGVVVRRQRVKKDYDDFSQGGYNLPRGVKPVHHRYKEHLLALIQTCHLFNRNTNFM